eukprot:78556-Alexandrium_andersonii.AAC.1
MTRRFAQVPEFCVNRVRGEDLITGACHVSVMNVVGSYAEIRPPAGYYLSLASGPAILEDLPSEEPD